MTDAEALDLDLDAELAACYANPLRYVMTMWPWGQPDTSLSHDHGPESWQRDFLVDLGQAVKDRAFDGHTPVMPIYMAIASGHGVGKSALGAWIVHWAMDTRPDCKAKVTANTQTQLETSTWAAIQSWGQTKLTADRWTCNAAALYMPGDRANWFCVPTSCKEENSQAFAGLHNRHSTTLYLFDEASTIPDAIFEVAMGGLIDGQPIMLVFGNPSRRSGQLYRAVFGSERDLWNHRIINGDHCAHSNKALYQQWRDLYGDDSDFVRVRILGLPPNADELQYIDHARVLAAQANNVQVVKDEPLIAGVDVSGGGSSWSVCRFRRGFDARSMPPIRITGEETMKDERQFIIAKLAAVMSDTRPTHRVTSMFVDSAYGAVLVARLRQMGYSNVFEVNFGGKSIDDHDANMRAYMWEQMKEWLPKAAIDPKDQRLADDLECPGFHLNVKNQLVLESKESIKERGLASPDDGDALALTFAAPVKMFTQTSVSRPQATTATFPK